MPSPETMELLNEFFKNECDASNFKSLKSRFSRQLQTDFEELTLKFRNFFDEKLSKKFITPQDQYDFGEIMTQFVANLHNIKNELLIQHTKMLLEIVNPNKGVSNAS